jgi:hypothetical protein
MRQYQPRMAVDLSGFSSMLAQLRPWPPTATLEEIRSRWEGIGQKEIAACDRYLADPDCPPNQRAGHQLTRAAMYCYEGEPANAYASLEQFRAQIEEDDALAEQLLCTVIFCQGVAGLRLGEDENCIACRGESSCILPISPAAVHTNPRGSRLAIRHFTEYLEHFPIDLEVRWLLNLASMTLGEHPQKVDPRFRLDLDAYFRSEFDIGRFRDVGHLVGVNRLNMAGGAVMDDFDNDGLLDLVVGCWDYSTPAAYYRNQGDGTFEERGAAAGIAGQYGAVFCAQADYDNDGHLDLFMARGGWLPYAVRPSLLRNNGDGTFTDVTEAAGLLDPVNSISAAWIDFDNDGHIDLFICCDRQPNRLYRNQGDGTFREVAAQARVQGLGKICKGSAWIDYDNDGYADLFLTYLEGTAQLLHNNRDGTFTDVTREMGIWGPLAGFSCWAFDFDNDGWLDIFATSYSRSLGDVVRGMLGLPHNRPTCKLYRNEQGRGFRDMTVEAGVDKVYATMGSNFGDFDNDGYLDFYLGTGEPNLSGLVPNRMFKNVAGKRFAEITSSSGTGHLQKGHAIACGDWDRNGTLDIFSQLGGAVPGDRYHNVLYQNPGQGNHWLSVKLVGKKTNRSAIGARITATLARDGPRTVHRHVSSGSSFGANPLEQHLGLGKAERVARLEIYWPTSGTTQVFHNIAVDQGIVVTEFASDYQKCTWKPVPLPK